MQLADMGISFKYLMYVEVEWKIKLFINKQTDVIIYTVSTSEMRKK